MSAGSPRMVWASRSQPACPWSVFHVKQDSVSSESLVGGGFEWELIAQATITIKPMAAIGLVHGERLRSLRPPANNTSRLASTGQGVA